MRRYQRKTKKGKIYYYVDFTLEGTRKRLSLGSNKGVADTLAKDIELKLMRKQLQIPEDPKISNNEWISRYLTWSKNEKSESTYNKDLRRIYTFRKFLEGEHLNFLSQINFLHLSQFKLLISSKAKRKTVNNYISIVRTMFRFAIQNNMLINNPSINLNLFKKVPRAHPRILTPQEIQLVLSVASELIRNVISILLLTGMRASEFIYLEWHQIDFEQKIISIECKDGFHTKNYQPRTVGFLPGIERILKSMSREGKYLFDNGNDEPLFTGNSLHKRIIRTYKKCGIKNANVHTLRHTFGTYLITSGIDVPTVQKLMGHKRIETTMKYCHIPDDHIRESLARVDFRVPNLCQIK